MVKYFIKLFCFLIILTISVKPQNNFLNNNNIYDLLDNLELKGIININHHQKPYSRQQIYKILSGINSRESELNDLLKDELDYFLKEYSPAPHGKDEKSTFFIEKNNSGASRFFEYSDTLFRLVVYPDFGFDFAYREKNKNSLTYYNGLSAYGSIGSHFSFDLDFNDISIKNNGYTPATRLTNERGYDYYKYNSSTKTINYDRTLGDITYSWDWGYVSLKKDYNIWGTGYDGSLILSDKAPSFPQLFFKVDPADWIEFSYLHGILNSSLYDSTTFRISGGTRNHIQLIEKYFIAHLLTFNIFNNLKFSIGESIVYSDNFEPIYLVPVLFFRMADHYLSKTDNNSGNAQLFSSVSYRVPAISTRADFSIFIDEMNITSGSSAKAIGYSIGLTNYDLFLDNLGIKLEYAKIDPFVYTHADPVQHYSNRSDYMGQWIENNTDRILLSLNYKPIPLLRVKGSYEYIRRGNFDTIDQLRYKEDQTFLYGDKSYYSIFNFSANYEIVNNLFCNVQFIFSNSWGKNNMIDVNDYKYTEISSGLRYGF